MPYCDFGIEYERGFAAIMRHLGSARASIRLLELDTRRCLVSNDRTAAANRAAAILHLAKHITSDHTIMSSLVAGAAVDSARRAVQSIVAGGPLPADAAADLREAIQSLLGDDVLGIKASFGVEAQMLETSLYLETVDDTRQAAIDGGYNLQALEGTEKDPELVTRRIAKQQSDQLRAFYTEVSSAWNDRDKIQALATRGEAGEWGTPVSTGAGPMVVKVYDAMVTSRNTLEKMLRDVSPGQP
jgi:hypothetical protein